MPDAGAAGSVAALWRYPVKSMLGEELSETEVSERGLAGDRARAVVDGATPTQRFRYIVLPQLLPTIAVLTVLRFIWTFNNFDDIYLLTGGGAGTRVVTVRVYDYLINRGDIGAAAAQALVLTAILAVLVGVYLKLFGRSEEVA